MLSIIVPGLDEADDVVSALSALAPLRARGAEVIGVDGGRRDDTVARATPHADLVIPSSRSRARQLNAGAARARGEILLFLHHDVRLPEAADALVIEGLKRARRGWGCFDVAPTGARLGNAITRLMNLRPRLTGIATGRQALFVTKSLFTAAGGYPETVSREDIEMSRRLRRYGPPLCLKHGVTLIAT